MELEELMAKLLDVVNEGQYPADVEDIYDLPRRAKEGFNYDDYKRVEGVYLIGTVAMNPHTFEVQYWLKIGSSSNLKQRMGGYTSMNPAAYRIDAKACPLIEERRYHNMLAKVGVERNAHSMEWVRVPRSVYMEVSNRGFKYFD